MAAHKRLLLLRHAEAEPGATGGDLARRLTGRGRRDAQRAGPVVRIWGLPELVLCSPATRALETLEALELGEVSEVRLEDRLHNAAIPELLELLAEVPGKVGRVLVVGHNPGLGELALGLSGDARLSSFRPCELVEIEITSSSWGDLAMAGARLVHLASPDERA